MAFFDVINRTSLFPLQFVFFIGTMFDTKDTRIIFNLSTRKNIKLYINLHGKILYICHETLMCDYEIIKKSYYIEHCGRNAYRMWR